MLKCLISLSILLQVLIPKLLIANVLYHLLNLFVFQRLLINKLLDFLNFNVDLLRMVICCKILSISLFLLFRATLLIWIRVLDINVTLFFISALFNEQTRHFSWIDKEIINFTLIFLLQRFHKGFVLFVFDIVYDLDLMQFFSQLY